MFQMLVVDGLFLRFVPFFTNFSTIQTMDWRSIFFTTSIDESMYYVRWAQVESIPSQDRQKNGPVVSWLHVVVDDGRRGGGRTSYAANLYTAIRETCNVSKHREYSLVIQTRVGLK